MGIFDFFKKTEVQKTTEETKGDACLGVLGFFPVKEKRELLRLPYLFCSIIIPRKHTILEKRINENCRL